MKNVAKITDDGTVMVKDFDDLLENYKYIGYETPSGHRYIVSTRGEHIGGTSNEMFMYTSKSDIKDQRKQPLDRYKVFDTASELFLWMARQHPSDSE